MTYPSGGMQAACFFQAQCRYYFSYPELTLFTFCDLNVNKKVGHLHFTSGLFLHSPQKIITDLLLDCRYLYKGLF